MRNKIEACVLEVNDSQIKFEENKRKIIFLNPERHTYKKVDVDGCTIKEGKRCDKLLLSADECEERYVELKGTDVMHAIEQLEATIKQLGENEDNRHSYVICTNVAPAIESRIQLKMKLFKSRYNSELKIQGKQLSVALY